MQVGGATVTVGGGTAILTLPDVKFTNQFNETLAGSPLANKVKDSKDFGDEIGYNVNGSLALPMGGRRQLVIGGFFARIDDDDAVTCASPVAGTATCRWVNIDGSGTSTEIAGPGFSTVISSERDVDQWGASVESRWLLGSAPTSLKDGPPPVRPRYIAVAADVRGIDQDLSLRTTNPQAAGIGTYNEDLDTRYYGAYVAYGGDYSPFLFRGLWERLGLRSSFQLRGGVYYAETDYSGAFATNFAGVNVNGTLNLSSDDAAFIGGLSLVTSKRLSARSALSLRSEYEYYSWVPEMVYANNVPGAFAGPNAVTSIGDDDAFAMRTSLRLTVGLGPDALFQ